MNKLEVMEKETQRKWEQAPSQPPPSRPGGPANAADVDILVIGDFKQDTPKVHILRVFDKAIRPKLAGRFDLRSWETFCPYLLSSVCFLGAPTPSQVVSFLRNLNNGMKVKLNGEALPLWSTIQRTRGQKDTTRRLIRLAAHVQNTFHPGVVGSLQPSFRLFADRLGPEGRRSVGLVLIEQGGVGGHRS